MIKDKKHPEKNNLVRYGKEETESNPSKNQIIKIDKYSAWRNQFPLVISKKKLVNKNGARINPYYYEIFEQYLMLKYLKPTDVVLEIGARYGIVSNTINLLLNNKKNHVVVEPDKDVLDALVKNKELFNSQFSIVTKPISNHKYLYFVHNELGSFTTPIKPKEKSIKIKTISSEKFFEKYLLKFNVLVADCEGCLENFLQENLALLGDVELIIFKKDNEKHCDYKKIYKLLIKNKFLCVEKLLDNFQQVWIKKRLKII